MDLDHDTRCRAETQIVRAGLNNLRRRRSPMKWGVSVHVTQVAARWVWCATTSGGETVRITGALLRRAKDNPLWLEGLAHAIYCLDAAQVLEADEPAQVLGLTHFAAAAAGPEPSVMVESEHEAYADADTWRFYAPRRLPGWPL